MVPAESSSKASPRSAQPVRIVHLPAGAFRALADGDLEAANTASPVPLTQYFVSPEWQGTWRRRSEQVDRDPASAAWVTGVVWDEQEQLAVGRAGYHGPPDDLGMVEIGYAVDPAYRRRGYARAALEALLQRAAHEPQVKVVRVTISPGNTASYALASQYGFAKTGEQWDEEDGLEIIYEVAASRYRQRPTGSGQVSGHDHCSHIERNRHHWDEHAAAWHGPLAREHWSAGHPHWGLWSTPESQASMLPSDLAGMRVIELGCGTGYVSAWLARAGAHPVGLDLSHKQLATARAMQAEFGLGFPLVLGDAEQVPFGDGTFDFAISDYGASLWCDPYRWIPEAARLLRPGGRLAFTRRSPLFALCAQPGGSASTSLQRAQFGLLRTEADKAVEFTLGHGEMVRLLRSCNFVIEDLIEIQAPDPAHREYDEVSADWSHRWPSEEIWKARLAD